MILKPVRAGETLSLSDRDAHKPRTLQDRDAVKEALKKEVDDLGDLQDKLIADKRHAVLVILQGRDASGKDGTIKNVFDGCNPQGVRVSSFGVPTSLELSHDFLWRCHINVPPRGYIGIWNRSHYEDVLAVRVRRIAPPKVWRARYEQINNFEKMLAQNGVTILKFFLHISRAEQRERLIRRRTGSSARVTWMTGSSGGRTRPHTVMRSGFVRRNGRRGTWCQRTQNRFATC